MDKACILIVDDELSLLAACTRTFTQEGYQVDTALNMTEAAEKLAVKEYDVLMLDIRLVGGGGRELLDSVHQNYPATPVVFLLGLAPLSAVETMRRGGYEYIPKPFTPTDLTAGLARALQQRSLLLDARRERQNKNILEFGELIGNGPEMRALFRLIGRIAPSGSSILVIGDEGTGKELVAKAIHRISSRRLEPFHKLEPRNDPNLSRKMFGYRNSAGDIIPGAIDEAGNGTLYIDEITSLDHDSLTRLDNAIRQRLYVPIDSSEPCLLSCRIIFSTGRNLNEARKQKDLPDDLFDDLMLFPIYLPSLHQRIDDIPALTYYFLKRFSRRFGRSVHRVNDQLLTRMIGRRWHENVRELALCVENMVIICDGDTLMLEHYNKVMDEEQSDEWQGRPPLDSEELKIEKKKVRASAVTKVERAFVMAALHRCRGNVTHAAQDVGMQRRNFQTLMRQHGIKAG